MLVWLTVCDCDSLCLLMSVQRVISREYVREDGKICEKVSTDLWELSPLQSILHTLPPLICQHNHHAYVLLVWFDFFDEQFSFFVSISTLPIMIILNATACNIHCD